MHTTRSMRRCLAGVFAVSAIGGVLAAAASVPGAPAADAATDPCAASEVAKTIGGVATSMGIYLDAHPDTNNVLTTISQQQQGPQSLATLKSYLDANPQVGKDLQGLQQPLVNLSARCRLPLTLPQVMGLLQNAQAQQSPLAGALPGGLPAASPAAQSVGGSGPLLPAESVPGGVTAQVPSATTGSSASTPR